MLAVGIIWQLTYNNTVIHRLQNNSTPTSTIMDSISLFFLYSSFLPVLIAVATGKLSHLNVNVLFCPSSWDVSLAQCILQPTFVLWMLNSVCVFSTNWLSHSVTAFSTSQPSFQARGEICLKKIRMEGCSKGFLLMVIYCDLVGTLTLRGRNMNHNQCTEINFTFSPSASVCAAFLCLLAWVFFLSLCFIPHAMLLVSILALSVCTQGPVIQSWNCRLFHSWMFPH